jgi:hypothetical protein
MNEQSILDDSSNQVSEAYESDIKSIDDHVSASDNVNNIVIMWYY